MGIMGRCNYLRLYFRTFFFSILSSLDALFDPLDKHCCLDWNWRDWFSFPRSNPGQWTLLVLMLSFSIGYYFYYFPFPDHWLFCFVQTKNFRVVIGKCRLDPLRLTEQTCVWRPGRRIWRSSRLSSGKMSWSCSAKCRRQRLTSNQRLCRAR